MQISFAILIIPTDQAAVDGGTLLATVTSQATCESMTHCNGVAQICSFYFILFT